MGLTMFNMDMQAAGVAFWGGRSVYWGFPVGEKEPGLWRQETQTVLTLCSVLTLLTPVIGLDSSDFRGLICICDLI